MTTELNRLKDFMSACQVRVEQALDRRLPPADKLPARLHQAMRYATLEGGKRLRPLLTYATGRALDVPLDTLDPPACAVEFIHVYSLIHDDLPAMDDDELRRGKPTCHVRFDEATAILAGDALQALAFEVLASDPQLDVSPAQRVAMIDCLAKAAGAGGMVGGQAIDLASVGLQLDLPALELMHIHKTGALIRASVRLAALAKPGLDPEIGERLDHYAKCIGLAFQIQDDILDEESDTATLGKTQGKDRAQNKPTYPALLGLAGAKQKAGEMHEQAVAALEPLGEQADLLRALSLFIIQRRN
ncbi:farnesyl diphosphate synthase [Methylomarinovum caldicuralii]|uniref:Farnesyl diphosphate synthase n=1 Tax=Methylomarinovum caldicuralii TaxID=438856 RepID=A0AAU9BVR9_9GAMM|nr:farnesyl diphosphate synthase [Methylomarinovum caldicuralii]BCX82871.1 farnesyl diphosphate synthase [Methylomarinovum caldicuralii]